MGEERYFLLAMFDAPVLIVVRDYDSSFLGVFRQIWADVQGTASGDDIASERLVKLLRAAGYTIEELEYRVVQDSTHDLVFGSCLLRPLGRLQQSPTGSSWAGIANRSAAGLNNRDSAAVCKVPPSQVPRWFLEWKAGKAWGFCL